jgi:segregation and condensation protein B
MSGDGYNQNISELKACLEALLFVAPEPVSPAQLAVVLELPVSEVEAGLKQLTVDYKDRGLRLQRHAGRIQLTTAPELAEQVERFLGFETTSYLSHAALEALAIVAFEQPVTRPQVDGIRGVNSDGVMKSLLHKGLIQDVGRSNGPGRPILYATTPEFLQQFGLSSLDELPPLDKDQPVPDINEPEEEL